MPDSSSGGRKNKFIDFLKIAATIRAIIILTVLIRYTYIHTWTSVSLRATVDILRISADLVIWVV